ncbi:MAG: YnfA family protein [Candidatus Nitrosotenuis sp.]|nr:YnfA family protein [Candidatus Nitrosotenuis sp.]
MVEVVITTLAMFFFAALLEIGGGYLVWKWLREHKGKIFGFVGGAILFAYGIVPTLQPAEFGRVYATYGGIFVIMSVIWGYWIDKKKPDRYEIAGSIVVLIGVAIMFYYPR